jgi:signal transduction histidine kinase
MQFFSGFWRSLNRIGLVTDNFIPSAGHGDLLGERRLAQRAARPRILLPWVVLAVGIPLSVLLASLVRESLENVARLRFERQTSEAKAVIEERIHSYADILYGLKAHFASLDNASRLQFHRFVESLDLPNRYPGFDVVSYAVYVPLKDKEKFENAVRNDKSLEAKGYPRFAINPPGIRPEYYVIAYVEPMQGFDFAFGLDMAANPEVPDSTLLLKTLQYQRDTGKLATSGMPLKLLSKKKSIGLAMRLAVYRTGMPTDTLEQRRAAYVGSVGAGFAVARLMDNVLAPDLAPAMHFKMYDAGPAEQRPGAATAPPVRRLLYDSTGQIEDTPQDASNDGSILKRSLPFTIGGRTWDVDFSVPRESLAEPIERALPGVVLLGVLLVSALLFIVLYSLASSRSRAVAIAADITKDLHASNVQLLAMSRQLVDLQEAERRNFARELHDQIGQNLTALSINIDILKAELLAEHSVDSTADVSTHGGKHRKRLENLATLVESTTNAIENVMSDLRPPMLDDYGLLPALQWYGEEFSNRTGIRVNVHGNEKMPRLPVGMEIALFRISQEALNNVAKHAQAGAVEIALESREGHCLLTVADNGIGPDTARAAESRRRHGMGMVTMRERTQAIGGIFEFGANPGGGSRVTVRAPC